jgi:Gas vesicle synthesis protein GvpL/GvpF
MRTHLYCILPREARAPLPDGLAGIAAAPVRALATDGIVAWVSDVAPGSKPTVDGIRAHDTVVQAALDTGTTPAPVRFAQRFENDAACRDALDRGAAAVSGLLANIQGFVEMTLILTPSTKRMLRDLEPVIPEMLEDGPGAGRRYLETLREREAATSAVRDAMDALAARLAATVDHFVRRTATHAEQLRMPMRTISHLVARDTVEAYEAALRTLAAGGDYRFLVVGPRAPYSFCGLGGANEGYHGIKLAD